jgi:hypothetical protein
MHFLLERSVVPGMGSAAAAAVIGIVPAALASWSWDEGFRRGAPVVGGDGLCDAAVSGSAACANIPLAASGGIAH